MRGRAFGRSLAALLVALAAVARGARRPGPRVRRRSSPLAGRPPTGTSRSRGSPAAGPAGTTSRRADAIVARLRRDGALDPAFGRRGRATVGFPGLLDTALAVDVERDGEIVLAGSSDVQAAVARLRG